jgi:predicted metal-dependent hydrolase
MQTFEYKIIRSSRRHSSTAIKITPEGGVEVHAPNWTPKYLIDRFIEQKKSWIIKKINQVRKNLPPQLKYVPGEKHLFFGESFPLLIKHHTLKRAKLEFLYNRFTVFTDKELNESTVNIKKLFENWYLAQGKKIITQKVDYFTKILDVKYNSIRIKRVSSIWGSCSSKQNLNFNRKLIMAPHKIVDYVVIHEVCHLIHHHHRKPFWDLVASLDPEYKTHMKWLNNNHKLLYL